MIDDAAINCAMQRPTRCWMSASDLGLQPPRRWLLGVGGHSGRADHGIARSTIDRGLAELRGEAEPDAAPDRIRRKGGGPRPPVITDPTLTDLKDLVEPTTRGDPTISVDTKQKSWSAISKMAGATPSDHKPPFAAIVPEQALGVLTAGEVFSPDIWCSRLKV